MEIGLNELKAKGSKVLKEFLERFFNKINYCFFEIQEEEINLEGKLNSDKKRLELLTKNLTEDLKSFKIEINNDISSLLKIYKEMQTKTANEVKFEFQLSFDLYRVFIYRCMKFGNRLKRNKKRKKRKTERKFFFMLSKTHL